ncbi:RPL27A [Ecytonucleospora hepatopenaei]|uniref:RPL27A n=1 Tax=Ecytonucleospora hepatopenaei TaxID=646526 RepID=A0A1W0E5T1_9MICR|nr:RPL27A [Ecytonucleospora hepatopenaei]
MSDRVKSSRKLRGKVAHGYGRTNKHRKHSGGRGKCGAFKFMKTWYTRYHPDFFGKKGMNMFHIKKNANYRKQISLARIFSLISEEERYKIISNKEACPVIDVREFGYHVVIGGELNFTRPLVVKARYITPNAVSELEKHGGKAVLCD